MKIVRKINDRLAGRYKRRERKLAPVAHERIQAGLKNGTFDERLAGYLKYWLPILGNQKRAGDLTFFVGSKLSRKMLNLKKEQVEPPAQELYDILRPWFDEASGLYDFDGVKLVPAESPAEAEIFGAVFSDILLPYLLGEEREDVALGISYEGPYEHGDVRLEPGDVALDCGSNMGMFAAFASKKGCRVFALEPSEYIRERYLDKNAALNGDITVLPYALSDKKETLRFFLDRNNIGSSIRADEASESAKAETKPEDFETVEAVTLDELVASGKIDRVDFIKADIEGSERLMLRGARQVLKEFAPKLSICTYHLPDDPKVLRDIILESQPRYRIHQGDCKLYARV